MFAFCFSLLSKMPSLLGHCWSGIRKSIRPIKIADMVICLEESAEDLHTSLADATATLSSLPSLKSRLAWPFWCHLTQVVLEKSPLNGCFWVSILCQAVYDDAVQGLNAFVCVLLVVQSAGGVSWSKWCRRRRSRAALTGLFCLVRPLSWYQSLCTFQLRRC